MPPATPQTQRWELRDEPCGSCGSTERRTLGFHGGDAHRQGKGVRTRIVQCRRCALIYANPMPYPSGEDLRYADPSQYFEATMGVTDEGRRTLGDRLVAEAERLLGGGRGRRFVDVGCGRGEVVWAAAQRGWEAEGLDISPEFVARARELGVTASVATLAERAFADATLDAVTLIEVIEHLYEPGATVRELARVIRPGGILFVSTPNEESIYQTLGNAYCRLRGLDWVVNLSPTWDLYHVQGFSPRSLRFLLTAHGFRIEKLVTYPGSHLPLPRRIGLWGWVERAGATAAFELGRLLGRAPFLYAWARRDGAT
jgi:2-polyprenyl-3-methyl-5-hydroxy-6-metoxy-1,4-benzoquinol methylase